MLFLLSCSSRCILFSLSLFDLSFKNPFIELSAGTAHERKGRGFIALKPTVALRVTARTPAVGALFVCFTFDLSTAGRNEEGELGPIARVVSPLGWLPPQCPPSFSSFPRCADSRIRLLLVVISKAAGHAWRFSCKKKLMRIIKSSFFTLFGMRIARILRNAYKNFLFVTFTRICTEAVDDVLDDAI